MIKLSDILAVSLLDMSGRSDYTVMSLLCRFANLAKTWFYYLHFLFIFRSLNCARRCGPIKSLYAERLDADSITKLSCNQRQKFIKHTGYIYSIKKQSSLFKNIQYFIPPEAAPWTHEWLSIAAVGSAGRSAKRCPTLPSLQYFSGTISERQQPQRDALLHDHTHSRGACAARRGTAATPTTQARAACAERTSQ